MNPPDNMSLPNTQDLEAGIELAEGELERFDSKDIRELLDEQPINFQDTFNVVPYSEVPPEILFASDTDTDQHRYEEVQTIVRGEPSLSMEYFRGRFDFKVMLNVGQNSSTKWAYSRCSNKLYMKPKTPVPLEISVNQWVEGAYLNITPVFMGSHFHLPVKRCPAHELEDRAKGLEEASHVVRFEGHNVSYANTNGRYFCEIPLGSPAPGEKAVLLYMKTGCWSTCSKGPDRKPFCVVITLFVGGREEGRQQINLKSCECPARDIKADEIKTLPKSAKAKQSSSKRGRCTTSHRAASPAAVLPIKKLKVEADSSPASGPYVNLSVPAEIVTDVKKYINALMAEKHARQSADYEPTFTDV